MDGSTSASAAAGAVGNLRARRGNYHSPVRPVPADFVTIAAQLCMADVKRHYRCSDVVARRWSAETGVSFGKRALYGRAAGAPLPDDFVEMAPRFSRSELCLRYGVKIGTISRWIKISGARPRAVPNPFLGKPLKLPLMSAADASVASQAAQYIRRLGPVVFSTEIRPLKERKHLPNSGCGLYFVGGKGHIPIADMIALAEAKGWRRAA